MYPSYAGGWRQPYPSYYGAGYSGYQYNQGYGYPPTTAPPPNSFYNYSRMGPSPYFSQVPNHPPQQQANPMPALTFDGMSNEDLQQAKQGEKQRMFSLTLVQLLKILNRTVAIREA